MQIHVSRKGEKFGPYTLEVANQYLAEGSLKPDDLAWHEGAPEWVPLAQVPGITAAAPFAAAKSRVEGMAIGSLGVSLVALVLGGVTKWGGILLLIITGALGLAGLALGIIGIVRIKNGLGDLRGKWLAVSGAVISPLAIVLAVLMNTDGAEKKENNTDDNGKSASDNKPIRVSKANRLKCANNLGQICKSFLGFASEHEVFPWQLHFQSNPGPQYAGAEIFNQDNYPGIALDLGNPKTLLSPCDPGFKEANQQMGDDFSNPTSKGISYGIHHGGDASSPRTILVFTRNVKGSPVGRYYYPSRDGRWTPTGRNFASIAAEKDALWQGGDHERFGMGGLKKGMGQIGMSDGSVHQSDDNSFSEAVHNHMNARGGLNPEPNGNIWRSTNE